MNNIQNGGLISKWQGGWLLLDTIYPISPWFMNLDGDDLYYSDSSKKRHLYSMNLPSQQTQVIVEEPVYLVQKDGQYLYYILETTRQLYRYDLEEQRASKVLNDEVGQFILQQDVIWYTNAKGIFCLERDNEHSEKVSRNVAIRLVCEDNILAYVDKGKAYEVRYMDIKSGEDTGILGSISNDINICNGMIFYSHAKNQSHLYRYSIANQFDIKFIPERTQNIHIMQGEICYFNQDNQQWRTVSLQGGKPRNLVL